MSTLKPEQLSTLISSGQIGSMYIFDGPENWLKERAVTQIINRYLPPEARDLNLTRLRGGDGSPGAIVEGARSFPFLADKRVVIVSEVDELSAAESRMVAENLENLPTSTILIFLYNRKASLKDEIPAQVSSHGSIITFWTPFPNQMPFWIQNEVKQRGKSMTLDAAQALAEACNDLQDIANELDKLFLFIGKKPTLDLKDIQLFGLPDGNGDFSILEEALWHRNLKEGLKQVTVLSEMGVRAESLLPQFERVFRTLLLARFYRDEKKWSQQELYAQFGYRGMTKQNQLTAGLRQYSGDEIREALEKVGQAHYDLKTGFLTSEQTLSLLVLNLTGTAVRRSYLAAAS